MTTKSSTPERIQKPLRKTSIKKKGSKNCPACFKKKIKCNHLEELCKKINNFTTPMDGFSNRLLFDGFKFDPKDRAKLDSIIYNQIKTFTNSLSSPTCSNPITYKEDLQKNFYEPIAKQFEKIAIEKVKTKDDISMSDETSSSSHEETHNAIKDSSTLKTTIDLLHSLPMREKVILVSFGNEREKNCTISIDSFQSVETLKRAIESSCKIMPKSIQFESFSRRLTVCDGPLLEFLKSKFENSSPYGLKLYCVQ